MKKTAIGIAFAGMLCLSAAARAGSGPIGFDANQSLDPKSALTEAKERPAQNVAAFSAPVHECYFEMGLSNARTSVRIGELVPNPRYPRFSNRPTHNKVEVFLSGISETDHKPIGALVHKFRILHRGEFEMSGYEVFYDARDGGLYFQLLLREVKLGTIAGDGSFQPASGYALSRPPHLYFSDYAQRCSRPTRASRWFGALSFYK